MKHLSREELIESLDGALPLSREAHMDGCASCRAERASLQRVLQHVAEVEVPEPSPLFWEHFGARVREAVERQPQPVSSGWQMWVWPRWAVGAATLLVCITLGWAGWRDYRLGRVPGSGSVRLLHERAPDTSDPGRSAALPDEDWNLVVGLAEDVSVDDVDEPGLVVRPGATDRALTDLSSEQRSELARLLTAEMARPAS